MCVRFSVLSSTSCVWWCSSARPDAPTVRVCEFHAGLLAIEVANPLCSWRFGGCFTVGSGSLLLASGSPHALCSLSPHGTTLIGWDIIFVWDGAFCGAGAANNSCQVRLNLPETSDGLRGGRNTVIQGVPRYRDHVFQN